MPPSLSAPLRQFDRLRREVQEEVGRLGSSLRAQLAWPAQDAVPEEPQPRTERVPRVRPFPHVQPHAGGWAIRREGSEDPERLFSTREAALGVALEVAGEGSLPVMVHREDGTIEEIIALL